MAGGTVGFSRRMSALSGHFPASSLSDETADTTNGMNSLDPVTYPSERASSKAAKAAVKDSEGIDHTFQKLFACMSIAYNNSAKMEAPQFKAYKGLRISVKEKMRLNNIVWREWYLQFGVKRNNKKRAQICHFSAQMEHIHNKPTCVVLEGKYWKRSNEVVKNEYMKWRVFFKERMKHWKPENAHVPDVELLDRVGRDGHQTISTFVQNQHIRAHYSPPDLSKEDYKMDLTDEIFSTLQSVGFPHQTNRDLLHLESSDLIQPELIGLEPDLYLTDVDAAEPLQELLADVMNIHMNTRFSSGQKRPGFPEHLLLADASRVTPPPAYPALKRSRSSTAPAPVDTAEDISDSFMDKIMTDAAVHSAAALTSPPAYDLMQTNQVSQSERAMVAHSSHQSGYSSSFTSSDDFSQFTQVISDNSLAGTLSAHNIFEPQQRGAYNQIGQPPFSSASPCSSYEQAGAATGAAAGDTQGMLSGQLLHADVQRGGHSHVHSLVHSSSTPYHNPVTAASYHKSQANGYAPASNAVFNEGSDCYSTSLCTATKQQLSKAASARLAGSAVTNNSFNSGVVRGSSRPANTISSKSLSGNSYNNNTLSASSYNSNSLSSNSYNNIGSSGNSYNNNGPSGKHYSNNGPSGKGCNRSSVGPVTVQNEFKKPEVRHKVVKPSDDEKSSFLTKLLKKPLDKEAADAEVVASSFASTPIHSVYFPSFTPITYTPQVAATNSLDSSQGKFSATGKESAGSPSADEDRKEAQTAERKRRIQIKTGFDALAGLVPTIATNTTTKTSKATMLTKTLEFIEKLQTEEKQMQNEMDLLTNEITALDHSISLCHGQLPATGVPTLSHHKDHMKSILRSYIAEQASKNWKFYVFSRLTEPLFDSFYNMVSTASLDDLYRSTHAWLDQYGSLASLRPALSDSLRQICTDTSILTDPSKFADEARQVLVHSTDRTSFAPNQPSSVDDSLRQEVGACNSSLPAAEQYSSGRQLPNQVPTSHSQLAEMRPPSSSMDSASQVSVDYRVQADRSAPSTLTPMSGMRPLSNYQPSINF